MPLYEIDGLRPTLGAATWIAPSAELIGDVRLGDEVSVWFGAVVRGDRLVLLQRGNGAPQYGLQPIDTTGELPLAEVLAWLDDPQLAPPTLHNVRPRHPGTIDGVRLTLTDDTILHQTIAASADADLGELVVTAADDG